MAYETCYKGTISEFELVTMRNRLERGKLNKAQRGKLFHNVPTGYVKVIPEHVEFDPDEQVQHVVRLIFAKFDELGSAWAVFRYLIEHHICLGIRPHAGPRRGQVEWRRPTFATLYDLLTHPIYAGVYAYGWQRGTRRDPGGDEAAGGRANAARWKVFQRDRLPAYISWERYLANLQRLRQNRTRPDAQGTPRPRGALLGGLIRCGNCGCRLQVNYASRQRPNYSCGQHRHVGIAPACHGLTAEQVDGLVTQQGLRALEPAALELSVGALELIEQERAALERHWRQRLERARYDSQEAERRYRAVDPDNRLVARTLERCWEEALAAERALADAYDRFRQEQPLRLSPEERQRIEQLSADIPRLWHAPTTTVADRKAILRYLMDEVVVHVRSDSEYTDVTIRWQGGFTSQHEVRRGVRGYKDLRDYGQLLARVVTLWEAGSTPMAIAIKLNEEGFQRPRGKRPFDRVAVRELLSRRGYGPDTRSARQLRKDEWWPEDLAAKLRVPLRRLECWVTKGWVHYRQTPMRRWHVLWADRDEVKRLAKLGARSPPGCPRHPAELTTPKRKK